MKLPVNVTDEVYRVVVAKIAKAIAEDPEPLTPEQEQDEYEQRQQQLAADYRDD